MKILLVAEYGKSGGALTFFKRILDIHQRNGISTAILIPEWAYFDDVKELCTRNNIAVFFSKIHRRRLFKNSSLALFLFDFFTLRESARTFQPDIIFISSLNIKNFLGASLFKKPVIFFEHSEVKPEKYNRFLISFFKKKIEKSNVTFATVSRWNARLIDNFFGFKNETSRVLYNSYRSDILLKKDSQNDKKIVLTLGHFVQYKNPETWFAVAKKVVAHIPDMRFIWYGDGDETIMKLIEDRIKADNLEGKIILAGHTDDIDEAYQNAAVYFQPSTSETHGIGVVEAMAHGLPCVVSNAGGLPESVVHGETGFIADAFDVETFSAQISNLLLKPELRAKFGLAGRRRAEKLFSPEQQEGELLALYANSIFKSK